MPALPKRLTTSPSTDEFPAVIHKPLAAAPASAPLNSIMGKPANPCSVVPSITTGALMTGKGESGAIVNGPVPGRLNWITSGPAVRFALTIPCRHHPDAASAVVVTTNVAAFEDTGARNMAE